MTYAGDPSLSEEIRQRVEETYTQSLQLAQEGKQQEATLGCEFVLRLDPMFDPARQLLAKIESGEALGGQPTEMPMPDFLAGEGGGEGVAETGEAAAASTFDLGPEFDDLLERRDFRTLLNLAQEHADTLQADPGLAAKASEAAERLEADPYVRDFLASAEKAQLGGRTEEAEQLVAKARALDPTHPALPPEVPTGTFSESNDRIRELLEEGQGALERNDFQGAIDSWSRIFLIDIDHPEANKRIEMARRMKAENERKVEEAYHEGVEMWERGSTEDAREHFETVLQLDPSHPGAREYITRMDAQGVNEILDAPDEAAESPGTAIPISPPDDLGPVAGAAIPTETPIPQIGDVAPEVEIGDEEAPPPAPAKRKGAWLNRRFLTLAGGGLAAVVLLLVVAFFMKDALLPNPDPAPPTPQVDVVDRAVEMHAQGQTEMAIAQLGRLPVDHPRYAEAQALLAQWQLDEAEPEEEGPSEEDLAARDALVAEAQAARFSGEYLRASRLLERAAGSAPLTEESELVVEEVQQRLADLESEIEMFEQGDWEFVLPELWKLHTADPGDRDVVQLMVDSYYNLGVRDLQRGDTTAAAEKFLRATELDGADEEVARLARFSDVYEDRPADLLYRIFVKYLQFR